jgi:hypothetical protein
MDVKGKQSFLRAMSHRGLNKCQGWRTNERISMDLIEDIQSLGSTIPHDTSACPRYSSSTRAGMYSLPLDTSQIPPNLCDNYLETTRMKVWKPTMILGPGVNQGVGLRSSCEQEAERAPQYSSGCRLQAMGSNRYRFWNLERRLSKKTVTIDNLSRIIS